MTGAAQLRIRQQVLEDVIDHLHAYADRLDEEGYMGSVESDDNAEYVRATIQQLKDAFRTDHQFDDDEDEDDE